MFFILNFIFAINMTGKTNDQPKTNGTRKKSEIRLEWRHKRRNVWYVSELSIFSIKERVLDNDRPQVIPTMPSDLTVELVSVNMFISKVCCRQMITRVKQINLINITSLNCSPLLIWRGMGAICLCIYISSCSTFFVSEGIW